MIRGHRPELGQPRGADLPIHVGSTIGRDGVDFSVFTIDLSLARSFVKFDVGGKFLWAIAATGTTSTVDVYFNGAGGQPLPLRLGHIVSGKAFHALYLSNAVQAGASLTLVISLDSNLRVENALSTAALVNVVAAATFAAAAVTVNSTAVEVLAASGTRRRTTLQAGWQGTTAIYVGTSNAVTTANGFQLMPGDQMVIEGGGAIWAIAAGSGESVRYFAESD